MTFGPEDMGRFEFVRLAALRAAQLISGSVPRVPVGYKATTTARREVTQGKIRRTQPAEPAASE